MIFFTDFVGVMRKARNLVTFFNQSLNWTQRLRNECVQTYDEKPNTLENYSLKNFVVTRWNSVSTMMASILKVETTLLKLSKLPSFPKKHRFTINFMKKCRTVYVLLKPLHVASLVMQRENNSLSDVLQTLLTLMQAYHYLAFVKEIKQAKILIKNLHYRWNAVEQGPYLLAHALDPTLVDFL